MTLALTMMVTALFLSASAFAAEMGGAMSGPAQPPLVGTSLPEFSLKTTGGGAVSLKREDRQVRISHDKKTAKPRALVIHFFQPDCFQCQVEMNALEATHQKYIQKGVSVIGIAHRGVWRSGKLGG